MTAATKKKGRAIAGVWAPREQAVTLGFEVADRVWHKPAAAPVSPPKPGVGSYTVEIKPQAAEEVAPAPHNRSFRLMRPKTVDEAKALIDRMSNSGERFAEVDS
ncbi:hypothetical protein [Paraburkholderia sp. SUR17]|uniref:hypothetical protein n=1 Tax=Paraburkholderia sp. SUR17 TaxID=3034358 RepID=UPI0024080B1D|nr:hypothetical protein [Paraburkholderia sp. SUR17]WEY40111.1 hypothetical protein P2869_07060 [Paraburkholderia sp. SUR17]